MSSTIRGTHTGGHRARLAVAAIVSWFVVVGVVFASASSGNSSRRSSAPVQVLGTHLERELPTPEVVVPAVETPEADAAIVPPPADLTGPVHLVAPPAALRTGRFNGVVPSGGTWAVVIGINDYPGSSHDLHAAVADADAADQALAAAGVPADHRIVLRDGQATAASITTAADWLVAHASNEATAVFFYAGHARHVSDATQVLVGADGGVVSDATLADHLRPLRARRTWITIAACYGGGFTEVLAPGRVLTAAAPADQVSYETTTFNHSYLVEYMVKRGMLDQQGGSTVQSAFAYAKAAIARDYPNRQPVEFESAADNLVLAPSGSTAAPRPSGATSQPQSQSQPSGSKPAPTTTTTAPPPPPADNCSTVTVGVVRCGSK